VNRARWPAGGGRADEVALGGASHALPTPPCTTCSSPRALVSITARRCISHVGQTPLCAGNEIAYIHPRTCNVHTFARGRALARIPPACRCTHVSAVARAYMACILCTHRVRACAHHPRERERERERDTGRSFDRFSAGMTVYGPSFCANFHPPPLTLFPFLSVFPSFSNDAVTRGTVSLLEISRTNWTTLSLGRLDKHLTHSSSIREEYLRRVVFTSFRGSARQFSERARSARNGS